MTLRAIEVAALCQAFVLVLASLAWAFLGPAAAVPILLVGTVTNALEYRKTAEDGLPMSSARLFAFAPHERGPSDFPRADVTDDVRWLLDMVRDLSYDDGIGGIPDEIEARIEAWMVLLDYPREQWPSEKREAQRQAVAAANRARRENLRKAAEEAARRARMWRDLTVEEQADLLLRASSADVDLPRLVDRDPEITLREFLPPIEAREREVAAGLRLRSFRDELADAEAEAAWYGRGLDSDTEDLP